MAEGDLYQLLYLLNALHWSWSSVYAHASNLRAWTWESWDRWGTRHGHRSPVLGSQFGERILSGVGAFLGVLEFVLHLAVFGQVDGGNLLSLFDLSLVGLDLASNFVNHILKTLLVLGLLLHLEGELLKTSVGLADVLLCLGMAALFIVELVLEFLDTEFKFLDQFLASLEGLGLSFFESDVQVLQLAFHSLPEFFNTGTVFLF